MQNCILRELSGLRLLSTSDREPLAVDLIEPQKL